MRFSGKTAVITGGAIGFVRAFAPALIGEGASAAILDIDASMARRTVAELTLAAEEPDVLNGEAPDEEHPTRAHRGQIDGTPEDGESLFNVDE